LNEVIKQLKYKMWEETYEERNNWICFKRSF
jgi:hypothetical protein